MHRIAVPHASETVALNDNDTDTDNDTDNDNDTVVDAYVYSKGNTDGLLAFPAF